MTPTTTNAAPPAEGDSAPSEPGVPAFAGGGFGALKQTRPARREAAAEHRRREIIAMIETENWDIIKDGVLVSYQTIRDQAHILGLEESQGCCYADSWSSVQFQRMPNVSLEAGKKKLTPDEMIKDVKKGIYIVGMHI